MEADPFVNRWTNRSPSVIIRRAYPGGSSSASWSTETAGVCVAHGCSYAVRRLAPAHSPNNPEEDFKWMIPPRY